MSHMEQKPGAHCALLSQLGQSVWQLEQLARGGTDGRPRGGGGGGGVCVHVPQRLFSAQRARAFAAMSNYSPRRFLL